MTILKPLLLLLLLLLLLGLIELVPFAAVDHSSTLLMMAVELRFSDIVCFGDAIRTPTQDRLAAKGERLASFFNGTPFGSTGERHSSAGSIRIRSDLATCVSQAIRKIGGSEPAR